MLIPITVLYCDARRWPWRHRIAHAICAALFVFAFVKNLPDVLENVEELERSANNAAKHARGG